MAVTSFPTYVPPEPPSSPFRPYLSHYFEAGPTSLLGMEILRWGAGREGRLSQ